MGPINWIAVVVGANLAVAVGIVWYGPLFGGGRQLLEGEGRPPRSYGGTVIAMLVASLMMGHNFARVGHAVLAAKPWLYWMMSGGLAGAFVWPALWMSLARRGVPTREIIIDNLFWMTAFLTMGTVFWALS